ncbi:hypothetical protein SB11R_10345 [Pseudomonas oryzihabitans]|nr:hypothetical protein SB11R_10345 [Pseudomonas psychrotolerans]
MSIPCYLYKYQSVTQYTLQSLANQTVWLSSPASFNDPFDCAINLDRKKLEESVAHAVDLITQDAVSEDSLKLPTDSDEIAYTQLRDGLRALMQKIGVFCLSETPNEILMWSHYADYHKGFCIEYRLDETSPLKGMVKPVRYTDVYPSLSLKNLPSGAEENFIDICVYTKAKQWSYEREWRAIMPVGEKLYRTPAPISAIIFGARMTDVHKEAVYEILHLTKDIEFKQAVLLEDFFGLDVCPYVRPGNS